MNIKQLRKELVAWGRYWASKEQLQGYASKSATALCCEVLQTGIWASSDLHLFSDSSEHINPPDWVASIDEGIAQLPPAQRRVINLVYIKEVAYSCLTREQQIALLIAQRDLVCQVF